MSLELRNVSLHIQKRVLYRDISLTIQPGEVWAILGPNGVGKTTFLHTLMGLKAVKAGSIWLENRPFTALSPKKIAQHIGLLFQETHAYFSQSVWEYCLASRFPSQKLLHPLGEKDYLIIEQALAQMDLTAYKTRSIQSLSGGEYKRLQLAALFAQAPHYYLLDEPFNHLDKVHQLRLLQTLKQYATTGAAILFSTHDFTLIEQYCDHVLLCYPDGTLLHGPIAEILTEQHVSALYGLTYKRIVFDQTIWWHHTER